MSLQSDDYQRKVLFQSDSFQVVAINWTNECPSPRHSHGWSQCMVLVEEGRFENIIDWGTKCESQFAETGQTFQTPVGCKHETKCLTPFGKTLHVYTPNFKNEKEDEKTKFASTSLDRDQLKSQINLSSPSSFKELFEIFQNLKKESISTHSPYFMNQLFSGIFPQMLLAEEFVAQTKTTLATYEASPVFSSIEIEVVDSLGKLIGWTSKKRSGISVPGGSAANFMAIHCARQNLFGQAKTDGIDGRNLVIFVSSEAHYSFKKACAALGIGMNNVIAVPVDQRGKMNPENLDYLIRQCKANHKIPLLVAATAGTTVLGAFDQISPLSDLCQQHQIWLHVDGAWGGPAIFSKHLNHLVEGIEKADSVTFDAHKLLGANLTSSFFLTKHPTILLEANDVAGGEYLFHSDDPNLDRGKLSWQCGRKADAMSFWAIWKSLGTDGIGDFIDRLVGIREEILPWIKQQPRLQLIAEPDYLNICVRILSPQGQGGNHPDWSKLVRERLKDKDLAMVNYSANAEGSFLRLILAHPFLHFSHVKQILQWALDEK